MCVKISVIVPYYRSKKSLFKLINSIPEQGDIEIIVVDDHSYDIDIKEIHHPFVKLEQQVEGKKWAGAARNLGISIAKGEYLLFADADDYFVDGAFEKIDKYLNENFDLVYFNPTSINENGRPSLRHIKYSNLISNYIKRNDEAIRYEFFVPWSKLYKSELIKRNGIKFDEVIASNDVMFSLMSGFHSKNFEVTSEVIYCVVESSNSLTKVLSEDVVDSRFNVLCRYNNFIKEKLGSEKQLSVISCISRAWKISTYKMLATFFLSLHKGYPILPSFSGLKRWIKRRFL